MCDVNPQLVAEAVEARRLFLGMTQDEALIASDGMVSRSVWSIIENGRQTTFRKRTIEGVRRALQWPADWLQRVEHTSELTNWPTGRLFNPDSQLSTSLTFGEIPAVLMELPAKFAQLAGRVEELEQQVAVLLEGQLGDLATPGSSEGAGATAPGESPEP